MSNFLFLRILWHLKHTCCAVTLLSTTIILLFVEWKRSSSSSLYRRLSACRMAMLQWYRFERQGRGVAVSVLVVASWFIALIIAGRSLSLWNVRGWYMQENCWRGCHAVSTTYLVELRTETCFRFRGSVTRPGVGARAHTLLPCVIFCLRLPNSFHSFVTRHSSFYILVHTFHHLLKT